MILHNNICSHFYFELINIYLQIIIYRIYPFFLLTASYLFSAKSQSSFNQSKPSNLNAFKILILKFHI